MRKHRSAALFQRENTHMDDIDIAKLHRMEKVNREVGSLIGAAIQESGGGYGFCLFMFSFQSGTEMTWISNAQRPDMIKALKEFIRNAEEGKDDELGKVKRWEGRNN